MLDRLFIYCLSAFLALAPAQSFASQNNLYSPTTGTVSGLQLTNNFNNAIDSVNTCNGGPSAPTNQLSGVPSVGNCWINSTSSPYPVSIYDGSNWDVIAYIDATNHWAIIPIGGGVATEASATTTDLCASANKSAHYLTISGTTTITSFGSTCQAGFVEIITFSGSLTLTYNATSMILPGAANIITAAGDQAIVVGLGSGNFQIVNYTPASGAALINPAIDVGAIEWTFSPSIPSAKYLWAYGQAVSRSTYSVALTALTITQSVTSTNSSPTLTGFSDTTQIAAGAVVEASFFAAPTTIVSCTSTTCTTAANANASTTGNVTIFPYGDGCGIATACSSVGSNFNLPDCRDVVMAGRGNMGGTARSDSYALTSTYYGASPNALGAFGGSQDTALSSTNQLPQFTPIFTGTQQTWSGNQSVAAAIGGGQGGSGAGQAQNIGAPTVTITPAGTIATIGSSSPSPFTTVQPTITANCMIRVLAMLDLHGAPAVNDNDQFAAIEPRRLSA